MGALSPSKGLRSQELNQDSQLAAGADHFWRGLAQPSSLFQSRRQGFHWWEMDMTYYVLPLLNLIAIVRELRPFRLPPLAGQGTA